MSRYKTVYTEVEVDVDLDDFSTEELIEELENRGQDYNTKDLDADAMRTLLETIYHRRRQGRQDYQQELDQLIRGVLGRII